MPPSFDYLIVGAGLFGATVARELTDAGKKCLVIDRRPHIAGNVYTELVDGIEVHKYGPHIFHTDNRRIWDHVNRFADFRPFCYRGRVLFRGKVYSFPINLMTLQQLWGVHTPDAAVAKLKSVCELRPENHRGDIESWCTANIGRELYDIFVKGYTTKQWGRSPAELPEAIIKRIPVRTIFDDRYFFDTYEGIPQGGYTAMVASMLSGIEVKLQCDFLSEQSYWRTVAHQIIYSGEIDQLFNHDLGRLEYRSLRFEMERREGTFQGCPIMNYAEADVPWTRITEYKFFMKSPPPNHTVIVREYPAKYEPANGSEPYYPVDDERNRALANDYAQRAQSMGIIPGGRLGTFRYMDMHQVIGQGLSFSERILQGWERRRNSV